MDAISCILPLQLAQDIDKNTKKILVIDARTFCEFNTSHITTAVNIWASKIRKKRLQQNLLTICDLIQQACHGSCFTDVDFEEVIVYDQSSTLPSLVPVNSFLNVLLVKLCSMYPKVTLLKGGFLEFHAQFYEMCEYSARKGCLLTSFSQPCLSVSNCGPTKILPFLFLGSQFDAGNEQWLQDHNISYELNVSTTCPKPDFLKDSHFLRVPVNDDFSAKLLPYFDETFNFIDKVRALGSRVLVHCLAGISRSPTVVISYVMKSLNIHYEEAYRYVKTRRPVISPNINFVGQLLELDFNLFGGKSSSHLLCSERRASLMDNIGGSTHISFNTTPFSNSVSKVHANSGLPVFDARVKNISICLDDIWPVSATAKQFDSSKNLLSFDITRSTPISPLASPEFSVLASNFDGDLIKSLNAFAFRDSKMATNETISENMLSCKNQKNMSVSENEFKDVIISSVNTSVESNVSVTMNDCSLTDNSDFVISNSPVRENVSPVLAECLNKFNSLPEKIIGSTSIVPSNSTLETDPEITHACKHSLSISEELSSENKCRKKTVLPRSYSTSEAYAKEKLENEFSLSGMHCSKVVGPCTKKSFSSDQVVRGNPRYNPSLLSPFGNLSKNISLTDSCDLSRCDSWSTSGLGSELSDLESFHDDSYSMSEDLTSLDVLFLPETPNMECLSKPLSKYIAHENEVSKPPCALSKESSDVFEKKRSFSPTPRPVTLPGVMGTYNVNKQSSINRNQYGDTIGKVKSNILDDPMTFSFDNDKLRASNVSTYNTDLYSELDKLNENKLSVKDEKIKNTHLQLSEDKLNELLTLKERSESSDLNELNKNKPFVLTTNDENICPILNEKKEDEQLELNEEKENELCLTLDAVQAVYSDSPIPPNASDSRVLATCVINQERDTYLSERELEAQTQLPSSKLSELRLAKDLLDSMENVLSNEIIEIKRQSLALSSRFGLPVKLIDELSPPSSLDERLSESGACQNEVVSCLSDNSIIKEKDESKPHFDTGERGLAKFSRRSLSLDSQTNPTLQSKIKAATCISSGISQEGSFSSPLSNSETSVKNNLTRPNYLNLSFINDIYTYAHTRFSPDILNNSSSSSSSILSSDIKRTLSPPSCSNMRLANDLSKSPRSYLCPITSPPIVRRFSTPFHRSNHQWFESTKRFSLGALDFSASSPIGDRPIFESCPDVRELLHLRDRKGSTLSDGSLKPSSSLTSFNRQTLTVS